MACASTFKSDPDEYEKKKSRTKITNHQKFDTVQRKRKYFGICRYCGKTTKTNNHLQCISSNTIEYRLRIIFYISFNFCFGSKCSISI